MLSVNKLITDAYDAAMPSMYDATDGNMTVVGCQELNRLITQLNNQGFLAMAQKWVDAPARRVVEFRKLEQWEHASDYPNSVDMEPPQSVQGVARKIGNRYVTLASCNHVQMAQRNPTSTATSWTYDIITETVPNESDHGNLVRNVGVLTLDGEPRNSVRVWYNEKIPTYKTDDTIYLPDLYNELLMSGLTVRIAQYFELAPEKIANLEVDFTTAKSLIRTANINQRMQQSVNLVGDYNTSYNNGFYGEGM